MNFDALLNGLKAHVAGMLQQVAQPRWGLVTAYDPVTGNIKVAIQPEGIPSSWIPYLHPWVGNGWGMLCPPPQGAMVKLIHDCGSSESPVAIGAGYNMQDVIPIPPAALGGGPQAVQQGEWALVHQSGSVIRLAADGSVYIKGSMLNVQGDLHVLGAITATEDIVAGHVSLQSHTHGGVKAGSDSTAIPNGSP